MLAGKAMNRAGEGFIRAGYGSFIKKIVFSQGRLVSFFQ